MKRKDWGWTIGLGVAGIVTIGALAACGSDAHTSAPDVEPSANKPGTNGAIIQMPDGFRNVAFTCFGKEGVYVTSRGAYKNGSSDFTPLPSSVFVVPNDPHCTGQEAG